MMEAYIKEIVSKSSGKVSLAVVVTLFLVTLMSFGPSYAYNVFAEWMGTSSSKEDLEASLLIERYTEVGASDTRTYSHRVLRDGRYSTETTIYTRYRDLYSEDHKEVQYHPEWFLIA